jgi:hypothetical protein
VDGGQPTGAEPDSWPRTAHPCNTPSLVPPREVATSRVPAHPIPRHPVTPGSSGGLVAESDVDPPGPIPNPVVTHASAGEYSGVFPGEARPLRAPQTTSG